MNIVLRLWGLLFPFEEKATPRTNPYRTAAEMPQEEPKIKPKKKAFKMDLKLGKHTKTFGYLMPVCGAFVGIGLLYDAPVLGLGIKWGGAFAFLVVAVFFSIMAIANADHGNK